MRSRALLGVALILAQITCISAQSGRVLKPVDEGSMNPGFLAFRNQLQAIVAKRDTAALLEILHPEIRASFGSDHGIQAFKALWNLDAPPSELWKELGTVLELGGTFSDPSTFTAPYTFSRWPDEVDSFDYMAVVGTNVRIRTEPATESPILATVSYAILEVNLGAKPVDGWTAVKFNGSRGYVSSRYIRSPIDYRARFSFSEGRWRMIFFLAGD